MFKKVYYVALLLTGFLFGSFIHPAFAEPPLWEIYNTIYGGSYVISNQDLEDTYGVPYDEVWQETNGYVEACARYAGYTQRFGYYTDIFTGDIRTELFNVTTTGYLSGYTATFLEGGEDEIIGLYDDPSTGGPWFSEPSLNVSNNYDHVWSFEAPDFDPDNPEYLIAWEDQDLGDADYNDLVLTIENVDPYPVECEEDNDCDDGVACTDDSCVSYVCQYTPNDANCDDGVGCTDDTCDPTLDCQYTANDANCDDDDVCTIDTCDPVDDCIYTPIPGCYCKTKIYRGGHCSSGEEIIYSRPGRRGLAMSCCEELELCVCSSCECEDTGFTWEIVSTDPPGHESDFSLTPTAGKSTVLDVLACPDELVTITIKVTDCYGGEDFVEVDVAKVVLRIGKNHTHPGTQTTDVELLLNNPEHHVKGLMVDICSCLRDECAALSVCDDSHCLGNTTQPDCEAVDVCKWDDAAGQCVLGWCQEEGGECLAVDNMLCTECVIDEDRASGFICSAAEQEDGCCRIALYTTEPDDLIQQGSGAIAKIKYDILDANTKDCLCLFPYNRQVWDQFNEEVCACGDAGEICFYLMGDIYPQDCYECTSCGDGKVDLFDILEGIDIILGKQAETDCQLLHGDVPNGMPPYCGDPAGVNPSNCETDGDITLGDAVVIIDMALGKMNCCDYCMFGRIY